VTQTKPKLLDQLKDHFVVWAVNNPEHAIRLDKVRRKVREWLR